jgi:hypothetical protein
VKDSATRLEKRVVVVLHLAQSRGQIAGDLERQALHQRRCRGVWRIRTVGRVIGIFPISHVGSACADKGCQGVWSSS